MVSPSKHRKIDRKAGKANISVAAEPSGNKKPKLAKIFENKKFYLDVKNRSALTKLEKQLKELGATVEQFLVREVNFFITDRNSVNTNSANTPSPLQSPAASISPSPSHSPSPSPVNINSPTDGVGARRTRSRAEAMLESVRQQPGRILYSADPFENAKAWRIPIYPLQKFLRFLEKKLNESSSSSGSRRLSGVKVLKGNYIKLEECDLRPEFRELKSWPRINYKSTTGCPFDSPTKRKLRGATGGVPVGVGAVTGNEANNSSRRERMTRKQQSSTDSDQRHGGYCEMCCQDYSDLSEHLVSPGHLKLANDPTQFAVLDNLIKETFHNNSNGDMCPTLLAAATTNNRRVLRSNKSPARVSLDCHDIMGNKHTNSDKQSDHRQSSPAPLLPNVLLSNNLMTNSASMTNGHVTRSTTAAIHRQQSMNSNINYSSVDQPPSDPSSNKKLPPQPPPLQEVQCNGVLVNHCHLTRLSVKTESLHIQQQQLQEQQRQNLSPTGSDHNNSHHLRSKKQLWLPTSLLGTTAEDDGNPVRVKNEPKPVSPKGKRRKLRRKRLSVEEKLIEDNKSYYKVEVLNSKLRSTGYYMTQRELELNRLKANESSVTDNSTNGTEQTQTKPIEKEPVVVRFKKVRKSELSLLSDEAESFMFGEPVRKDTEDESSTETEDNSNENHDNSSSSQSICSNSNSSNKKEIKKEEIMDESSMGSCSSSSQSTTKRKRRTHAEMFIHDNLDYYKFDIQGSRLRIHGGLLQPVTNLKVDPLDDELADCERKCKIEDDVDDKSKIDVVDIKQEDETAEDSDEMTADQLSFSFESVPELEPWYQTFRRQDECDEIYHPVYSDYPKIRLPYEYPSFIKQKLLLNAKRFPFRVRKKRRRFLKNLEDKPRKSPRCHASTLAILSSLKYRRKKDSPDKLKIVEPIQPQETPLPPPPQPVVTNPLQLHEEESRSSLIDVSSLPDTTLKVPEEKVTQELNMRDVAESIDVWFHQLYNDEVDSDKYVNLIKVLSRALVADDENQSSAPSTSHTSKGKQKSSKSSPKNHTNGNNCDGNTCSDFNNWDVCLDIDPSIISEMEDVTTTLVSGPEIDMSILIDNYRNCNSMERADYEHLHPRAIDALRFCATDGSCNSSDCGGSSTCELLGFTEDGRMLSKRRKRKKRNMTGWPKDKPRKLATKTNKDDLPLSKCDATASSLNDVNKFDSDDVAHTDGVKSNSACDNDLSSVKNLVENDNVVEPSVSAKNIKIPIVKVTRSLSRTGSCDSSGPLSDCGMCFVHVGPRHLRGHSISVDLPTVNIKSSPVKRRASSPEKRSPGRGRRRRTCVTKWSPWASRRGR